MPQYRRQTYNKATSKGSQGSCRVSTDVGSADEHRTLSLQTPVTAESRVPLVWIFAINHNRRDRLTFRPDAIIVTPKKTCNDQGLFKEWKEGGFG